MSLLQATSLVHIPRGVVHSFRNGDRQAKLLATFAPGTGIETVFLEDSTPMTSAVQAPPLTIQPARTAAEAKCHPALY